MNKIFYILFLIPLFSFSQKEAYKIFNSNEKPVKYSKLLKNARESDIILFGEFHDNPIIHWLQLELTMDLYSIDTNLVLGSEMFEVDNQLVIDEYLAGFYNVEKFISECKVWPNFKTDYLPILNFAKDYNIDFIATNIPRRYASIVYNYGLDTLQYLSNQSKKYIAPLPIKLDTSLLSYQEMLSMGYGHAGDNLPKSQAIKDATMAYFISQNLDSNGIFIHYNGSYHSKDYEGIYWYLKSINPQLNIMTIGCEEQKNISKLNDRFNNADYIIVTPKNMTKTY